MPEITVVAEDPATTPENCDFLIDDGVDGESLDEPPWSSYPLLRSFGDVCVEGDVDTAEEL